MLWRTLPCPIPPGQRHRLQGVRLAGPAPLPQAAAVVQRRVSSRGGIQVARQRIQVGMTHAGKMVTVVAEDNSFRLVIDGETVGVVPRTAGREIDRYKAHATRPEGPDAMPGVRLDTADAAEFAELLQFLAGWLARDPGRLAASLEEFAGNPAYGITQLHQDLERFVFLLGGSDGEQLFGPAG